MVIPHDTDYLWTQSSLTQEKGFFTDPIFPISSAEAEIEESFKRFISINTIDTSDLR